ncbi:MAG: 4Fe-4S dicluster domain-containing protein [Thermoanaerobaculales bacterium]|jgi:ferredoxin|nr:4Fe-4S dicluster domain-containing protein [Thermoanaerobaculales bacterium]
MDTAALTEKVAAKAVPIYIMGKRYEVPEALTIMKAMEYAGYQYIRGCGCRGGVCGACATVYRKAGDYKIYTGLACQTVVEPDMYLAQIPFYPANRATYDFESAEPTPETVFKLYPELFRCVACNACTKVCPMDVEVLDYVSALKRGDLKAAAEISFDCIQCGLCASRCMGEMAQYHIAQLARRLAGGKLAAKAEHLGKMCADIEGGAFADLLGGLKSMSVDELKKVYTEREMEPHMGADEWTPASSHGLA